MKISPLPPGVWAEKFTHNDGSQVTIYRAPVVSEGPELVVEGRQKVLYYMYASYVFRWPEGASRLDIGHGTIRHHMGLHHGVPITRPWGPNSLSAFARTWVQSDG